MMNFLLCLLCILVAVFEPHAAHDPHYRGPHRDPWCRGKPDSRWSPHYISCYSYSYCENQREVIGQCALGKVFERDSLMCKDFGDAKTACGTVPDCIHKRDGIYGDVDCQTWYWCLKGKYLPDSRQYCPLTTVWDAHYGYCNHESHVPPPCGTYHESP